MKWKRLLQSSRNASITIIMTCLGKPEASARQGSSLLVEVPGRLGLTANSMWKKRTMKSRNKKKHILTKKIICALNQFVQQLHPYLKIMIPLREHNDIVEKLMKELNSKDQEIKNLQKEKTKNPSQTPQLQPTKGEELLNKKITQLNKEHKERVNNLTQQIRAKSIENKELKERLITKHNLDAKQKEHIAEIIKKTYDRKPSSGTDYKISALISHYEAEIDKKNKFSESLQKKIRELEMAASSSVNRETLESSSNENYKIDNGREQSKGISFSEHQKQMNKVRGDLQKFKKLFQEKDKEYKDLARRYSELTNQYYKIINSYGIQEQPKFKATQTVKSQRCLQTLTKKPSLHQKTHALQNLLHEMACSQSEPEEATLGRRDFTSKVANIQSTSYDLKQQSLNTQNNFIDSDQQIRQAPRGFPEDNAAAMKLEEIMEELNVHDANEITPKLIKIKTSLEEYSLVDTIARSLQVFFCNIGKGKLTKKQLIEALQDLQIAYFKNIQAVDILDEVCIEAGAKRDKLKQKVHSLLQTTAQYYSKLKSIKFMQEVAKGNKVVQFIEFFDLDKEELALPQQLIRIQEQLKSIDKFIKESRAILDLRTDSSSQEVLELVLRYLQKTTALVSQLERKKDNRKARNHQERQ